MHWAADFGHVEVLKYLHSKGAKVNVNDNFGITPLLAAVYEVPLLCICLLYVYLFISISLSIDLYVYIYICIPRVKFIIQRTYARNLGT